MVGREPRADATHARHGDRGCSMLNLANREPMEGVSDLALSLDRLDCDSDCYTNAAPRDERDPQRIMVAELADHAATRSSGFGKSAVDSGKLREVANSSSFG